MGISAGDILHQLFNTEDRNVTYAAFVIEYAGEHYALQAGFRPGYNTKDTQHDGFLDKEITDQLSFSGHLALTKTLFSDEKWLIRAGIKSNGGWSQEDITSDSGFDRVITRRLQWNAGVGPVVDFKLFVHPRISVGLDASLIYTYSKSELQQIFTNFPDFNNTKEIVKGHAVEVIEPATLYLRYHF
jgi:hypothetical protein